MGNMRLITIITILIIFAPFVYLYSQEIMLGSSSLQHDSIMPSEHTCDGANQSPPLYWSDNTKGVKSYVLVFEDIDAPVGSWVHWILFNIPSETKSIDADAGRDGYPEDQIKQGINDWGRMGYGGPCPPQDREHRYFFRIYALDRMLDLEKPSKKELDNAMKGNILATGELMTKYRR